MRDDSSLQALVTESYRLPEQSVFDVHARSASWLVCISGRDRRWWLRLERTAYRAAAMVELEAELVAHVHAVAGAAVAPVRRTVGKFASIVSLEGEQLAGFLVEEAPGAVVV